MLQGAARHRRNTPGLCCYGCAAHQLMWARAKLVAQNRGICAGKVHRILIACVAIVREGIREVTGAAELLERAVVIGQTLFGVYFLGDFLKLRGCQ